MTGPVHQGVAMKHVSYLIKPASSLCNLDCQYCFYADVSSRREIKSHGIMTRQTMEAVIDSIFSDLSAGDHLNIAFQGGEPTLAGQGFFEDWISYTETKDPAVHVNYSIQTNGIVLDDTWVAFLKQNQFLVGLSLDGTKKLHDANRTDHESKATHDRVMQSLDLLKEYDVPTNILTVLTKDMSRQADDVMDFFLKHRLDDIQFIPCLDSLDGNDCSQALTPEDFVVFYDQVMARWLAELRRGHWIHIQLIDAVIGLLANGREVICGLKGNCHVQQVVEADGCVYPCDFYVLDEFRMANLTKMRPSLLRQAPAALNFLADQPALADRCKTCSYLTICRGGCKRMRNTIYFSQTEDVCGYQLFLDHHYQTLRTIARQV